MVVVWGCSLLVAACARARALRRVVQLPALLCCEAMVWAVTFLASPLRLLTAVERERKAQMDDLVWENKDLEEKLQAALREQEAMEAVLDEMEEEHEEAFARIDVLESQLKALGQENMRLNEHKGKSMWDKAPAAAAHHGNDGKNPSQSDKKPWVASNRDREEEEAAAGAHEEAFKLALTTAPVAARSLTSEEAKLVARRRSLFSLGMSLAVGAAVWSADAPCLPLLAGLFAVVGVSMRSVSRSCAALRRSGPAVGDAVALLSLNWFLLGVLTSPMLGPALTWFAAAMSL
ncbi:uncharacterized protein LOC133929159 isoform X2 [Phragmites australis]|uniref:uncharacterized protein LOC133929159 isoform X2 n=1 Tax=Phragmites australis TaxID=29695 RepID=UPI002D779478|nr:uncharacterized protein LOC133929159 isoform X2 [Phragmites australis]